MTSMNLLVASIAQKARLENASRMDQWMKMNSLIWSVGNGFEFALDLQDLAELDCILVSLEHAEPDPYQDQARMMLRNLSRCWVGQVYELLRAMKQRIMAQKKDSRPFQWTDELQSLFVVLEATRMMLFKRELAKVGKKGSGPVEIEQMDADGNAVEPYIHGKTVLSEHGYGSTGHNSPGWLVYCESFPAQGMIVYRKQISDDLLQAFSQLLPQT